jgi:hypothetical protein
MTQTPRRGNLVATALPSTHDGVEVEAYREQSISPEQEKTAVIATENAIAERYF